MTLTDQTCHFHILDQAIPQILPTLSISKWQFSQPMGVSHRSRSFLTFAEVTVQLGTSYLSQDAKQVIFPTFPRKKKQPINESAAKTGGKKMPEGVTKAFFDHCLYRLLLFPQTFTENRYQGNDWHLDVAHQEIKPGRSIRMSDFGDLFRTSFRSLALSTPIITVTFSEGF